MIAESLIEDNKTIIPEEILKKIKGKELIKWTMRKDGKIELELEEISLECKEFGEKLDILRDEVKAGKCVTGDMETLAKRYGL